jgi:hypothetical protein
MITRMKKRRRITLPERPNTCEECRFFSPDFGSLDINGEPILGTCPKVTYKRLRGQYSCPEFEPKADK